MNVEVETTTFDREIVIVTVPGSLPLFSRDVICRVIGQHSAEKLFSIPSFAELRLRLELAKNNVRLGAGDVSVRLVMRAHAKAQCCCPISNYPDSILFGDINSGSWFKLKVLTTSLLLGQVELELEVEGTTLGSFLPEVEYPPVLRIQTEHGNWTGTCQSNYPGGQPLALGTNSKLFRMRFKSQASDLPQLPAHPKQLYCILTLFAYRDLLRATDITFSVCFPGESKADISCSVLGCNERVEFQDRYARVAVCWQHRANPRSRQTKLTTDTVARVAQRLSRQPGGQYSESHHNDVSIDLREFLPDRSSGLRGEYESPTRGIIVGVCASKLWDCCSLRQLVENYDQLLDIRRQRANPRPRVFLVAHRGQTCIRCHAAAETCDGVTLLLSFCGSSGYLFSPFPQLVGRPGGDLWLNVWEEFGDTLNIWQNLGELESWLS